jgi:hypothetical protein
MSFQITSLRYFQSAQAKRQTQFEHSDLAISEVSHYGFLKRHSSIS